MQNNSKQLSLFLYLLALTAVFVFFEIAFFLHWTSVYLGDYKLITDQLVFPKAIIPPILFFLFVQLSLHLFYATLIWVLARSISTVLKLSWKQTESLGLLLWIIGLMTVFLINQYLFPNSKFSEFFSCIIPSKVGMVLLFGLMPILAAITGTATIGLMLQNTKIKIGVIISLGLSLMVYTQFFKNKVTITSSVSKPNIIIIGIDSLRPDFLGFFGGEKQTPHLDHFLNQATVFSDAMTPLASTFPAWVSILTGEYPKHTGARTVLADQSAMNLQHTLPLLLKKQGYQTIYATDETRFSNIDKNFGFDSIVSPPTGLNDFLLGSLNDFPLSNLVINSIVGHYLFPFSYANRGVFSVYDPDSFLNLMVASLKQIDHRPVFLAVHFCLPHYPYEWGTRLAADKPIQKYQDALHRVDQQFNDFMAILAANQLLSHSVVIVLSDHGEGLELPGDRATTADLFISKHKGQVPPHFYPPSWDKETVNQSGGHGTDVLGLAQYHVLLAFRFNDNTRNQIAMIPNQVSLLDIKPTLLSLLTISDQYIDGHSLLDLIKGKAHSTDKNDFILESSFSPSAVRSVHPETKAVLFQGVRYFQIDPITTHMVVKKDMLKLIVSSKQYADMYDNWMLALYPQEQSKMVPILINLRTGEWTDDLDTSFALHAPVAHMLFTLKHFFGNEITHIAHSS